MDVLRARHGMLEGAKIIVVVPALDEAPRIGRVLASMPPFVDHVVVVDDGSSDGTAEAATAYGDPRVEVVRHARNRGVGAAIASGYRRALAIPGGATDAFCVMAGDGQMAPDDLARVALPVVRGLAAYAKGDRLSSPSSRAKVPWARRVGGLGFSWLTSLALGREVTDSQCGFTALARGAAAALDLDGLWPRYGYPNDLLGQLVVRGLDFVAVPVEAVYAGEPSKLRLWHLPLIAFVVGRAASRRARAPSRDNTRKSGRLRPTEPGVAAGGAGAEKSSVRLAASPPGAQL